MVGAQSAPGAALLLQTLEGPIRHALLVWALDCGLFDHALTPQPPEALAQRMALPCGPLTVALRALVAAGFLEIREGSFCTAAAIAPYVTADSPQNLTETLRMLAQTRHAGLGQLPELVSGAAFAPGARLFGAAHWDRHHRSLLGFHRAVAVAAMAPCLTGLPEWPAARSLLEIGPGSAELARHLLALRPQLQVTLFDLPPIAQRLQEEGADLPVRVLAGNYNDTLPEGRFDIIWCSMTLYFHDAGLAALIARLADRLAPGGVLLSFHEALTEGRTQPAEHVLGRLLPALRQGDVSFSSGEIAAALAKAGLVRPAAQDISTPFGRFRLDSARKEA